MPLLNYMNIETGVQKSNELGAFLLENIYLIIGLIVGLIVAIVMRNTLKTKP